MPVSVITVSNDTGTSSADLLLGSQLHFHRRKLFEVVAEVLDQRAGRIVLARGGAEEAELGGLVHDQAELAIRECGSDVPSSMPNCATASALSGAAMPGTAGMADSMPT